MRLTLALLALTLGLAGTARALDVTPAWKKHCASCHGMDGKGETPMGKKHKVEDLSSAEWQGKKKHTDAFIRDVIANGIPETKMKAFKDKLTDEEIDAMIAYIRALKP
jgi:cytochrome c6